METFQEIQTSKKPFTKFIKKLVESEPRFRFHRGIGNDYFNDEKFFVVTKDIIHISAGQIPSIEHEIAHAVEMKDRSRWLLPDWGMKLNGFSTRDVLTPRIMFAAMAREIRVRAIQLHMEYYVHPKSTLINILNNEHAWGSWANQMVPYGRFKTYQDVEAWVGDLREKTFKAWNQDRIIHEWNIRLRHWQNWMETKA